MKDALKSLLASRKTILTISGLIVALAAKYGLDLDAGTIAALLAPIVAQILGVAIEGPKPDVIDAR